MHIGKHISPRGDGETSTYVSKFNVLNLVRLTIGILHVKCCNVDCFQACCLSHYKNATLERKVLTWSVLLTQEGYLTIIWGNGNMAGRVSCQEGNSLPEVCINRTQYELGDVADLP
jgi:hypothetical protein